MLRLHFLHHRKHLPMLCRCAWGSLTMFFHEALDRSDVFPGGILVPQTFSGMANWNPHVHALITDTCRDREGNCYPMPEIYTPDLQVIEKLFAGLVFKMFLEEGMIAEKLVDKMRSWKHSGFSVYCGEPIEACDDNGRKTLSEYISRTPFSLEWIARITSHIPRKGAKQVIYYGAYSPGMVGKRTPPGHFTESTNRRGSCFDERPFLILPPKKTDVSNSSQESLEHRCPEVSEMRRTDESHLPHRTAFCHQAHTETP